MDSTEWIILALGIVLFLIFVYVRNKREIERRIENKVNNEWGKAPVRKFSHDDFENISHYFKNTVEDEETIDDITWNDLDMDRVFSLINNTYSSVGQEYLYKMLRMPAQSEVRLREFDTLVETFRTQEDLRKDIQKSYIRLGYARTVSVSDYMEVIKELERGSNMPHFAGWLLIAAAAVVLILNPSIGIMCFMGAIGYSVVSYYKYKAKVEPYFICVNHIIKLAVCAEDIGKKGKNNPVLKPYAAKLAGLSKDFSAIVKNSMFLGAANGVDGSLAAVIMDYVRILTHIDLIKFNGMIKLIGDKKEQVNSLMEDLGILDSAIAVASFREYLEYWCRPELTESENGKYFLKAEDIYHPLVENPVSNSIDADSCVLLTGSNASGKSTFLKTIAINAILSQTIFTSTSVSYKANYFRIYSSMALKDDISRKESYYMAEIKALKRIMDAVANENSKVPVLCFIDEVLRGTNTIERIAASSQVLFEIASANMMCFAATHDIELTEILENVYANYHFQEEVLENDISFNYRLYSGRATSRNAIKLLSIMGYADSIIENADSMAEEFMKTGDWKRF